MKSNDYVNSRNYTLYGSIERTAQEDLRYEFKIVCCESKFHHQAPKVR